MKLYFPTINLLRALAALMVCFYHFCTHTSPYGPLLPEGDIVREIGYYGSQGVFIFFVISGFVIPLSLYKYDFKIKNFIRFMARRWIRIEIPYIASILVYLFIHYLFCIANGWPVDFPLSRFFHHVFYTIPFSEYNWLNVIYWTLAIEFQFYILIGLIYPILVHRNKWLSIAAMVLFVVSGIYFDDHRFVIYYAPIFALGIMLFRLKTEQVDKLTSWIMLTLISVATFYLHGSVIGIFTALTVILIAFVSVDNKIFNAGGNISYSLYLIHGAAGGNFLYFVSRYTDDYFYSILLLLAAIIIAIIAAWLFWFFIEKPSQRLSKKVKI